MLGILSPLWGHWSPCEGPRPAGEGAAGRARVRTSPSYKAARRAGPRVF